MSPYFIYIFCAYGISITGLFLFLILSFIQLKQSIVSLQDDSRET